MEKLTLTLKIEGLSRTQANWIERNLKNSSLKYLAAEAHQTNEEPELAKSIENAEFTVTAAPKEAPAKLLHKLITAADSARQQQLPGEAVFALLNDYDFDELDIFITKFQVFKNYTATCIMHESRTIIVKRYVINTVAVRYARPRVFCAEINFAAEGDRLNKNTQTSIIHSKKFAISEVL